jgi:hypothetical protein
LSAATVSRLTIVNAALLLFALKPDKNHISLY